MRTAVHQYEWPPKAVNRNMTEKGHIFDIGAAIFESQLLHPIKSLV